MDPLRKIALDTLKERRAFERGSPEWQALTRSAWVYLQMAMRIPANRQTRTPPPVTTV